jgi:hypothetical protein
MDEGLAQRGPNGSYVLRIKVPKKALKAARG